MKRKTPHVTYTQDVDSPTKFVGMEVPRGCGCSSGLFLAFIAIMIFAAIVKSLTNS